MEENYISTQLLTMDDLPIVMAPLVWIVSIGPELLKEFCRNKQMYDILIEQLIFAASQKYKI